ncbi:unnamed protein product [Brachionus calyciflorus]|uniref:Uncharacterized protein n=1 Tax=Brachionus calyciflorus TaxID=104777 RepID=A0A813S954_9BILA|nr:unnamed protein product [Brachionus calyciflorus]
MLDEFTWRQNQSLTRYGTFSVIIDSLSKVFPAKSDFNDQNLRSNIDNIEEQERGCYDGISEENVINNYDVPYISDIDINMFKVAVKKIIDCIKIGFVDSYRFLSVLSGEQKKEINHQCELNDIDFEKKGTRYEIVNIFKKLTRIKTKSWMTSVIYLKEWLVLN